MKYILLLLLFSSFSFADNSVFNRDLFLKQSPTREEAKSIVDTVLHSVNNSSNMSYNDELTEEEIDALINSAIQQWGSDFNLSIDDIIDLKSVPKFKNVNFQVKERGCFIDDHFFQALKIVNIDDDFYICLPIGLNENKQMVYFFEIYYNDEVDYISLFQFILDY